MNLAKTDLRLLFAVEAIHRLGSLTAAAQALNLTQPALSHALARMRHVFDDALFVRTPHGMLPTPRGKELAASAQRIMAIIQTELSIPSTFVPADLERLLTLSMSDVGELVIIPSLLERIRAESPRSSLETRAMPPAVLSKQLADGEIDLAVGYFPDLKGAGLKRQLLFERGFVCLCAAEHPRLRGKSISVKQFLSESHLVVHAEGRAEELFERFLRKAGYVRRVLLSVPHMFCMPTIIAQSDLIVTVPQSVGNSLISDRRLKLLLPPVITPRIPVAQYWNSRFTNDPVNRWLRGIVQELFSSRSGQT